MQNLQHTLSHLFHTIGDLLTTSDPQAVLAAAVRVGEDNVGTAPGAPRSPSEDARIQAIEDKHVAAVAAQDRAEKTKKAKRASKEEETHIQVEATAVEESPAEFTATTEDVRDQCRRFAAQGRGDEAAAIIKRFGVANISAMGKPQLAEAYAQLSEGLACE